MIYSRSNAESTRGQKSQSLEEYLESSREKWFLTGKKKYTVQAMMVSKEMTFHNDLEVVDLVAADDGETVVLKGTRDEIWTSPLPQVISRYTKPDGRIPTKDKYYAMHVPNDITVVVETAQGNVLHSNLPNAPHGEGDFLVCTIREDGEPDLSDIWILNGLIFMDCYDTSNMDKQ